MSQVILLSLTASLNPTLVAATTVMLLLDRPKRLMLGYLLGAYLTSITLGLVIVFSLSDSATANTTQSTVSPAVNIGRMWLLELPLVCYFVAPAWTPGAVERAKAWVRRHAHRVAVRGFTAIGALLVIKGVVGLVS